MEPSSQPIGDSSTLQASGISIVGIGCRLPGGASSPAAFWELLSSNETAISGIPSDRGACSARAAPLVSRVHLRRPPFPPLVPTGANTLHCRPTRPTRPTRPNRPTLRQLRLGREHGPCLRLAAHSGHQRHFQRWLGARNRPFRPHAVPHLAQGGGGDGPAAAPCARVHVRGAARCAPRPHITRALRHWRLRGRRHRRIYGDGVW